MGTHQNLTAVDLVSTDWLAGNLDRADLKILDATVVLDIDTWAANSGRRTYDDAHIPGADFVDIIEELSDASADRELPRGVSAYRLPSAEQFASAVAAHGVGNETNVVAYDTTGGMWAARLWWLLRVFGHDKVAVLDGGWRKWLAEGRPTSAAAPTVAPARFEARLRPELLATKEQVAAATTDDSTCLVHALSPEMFSGAEQAALPRAGRIPSSVNVPFMRIYREDGTLRSPDELRELFAPVLASGPERVVTYCGGGIAASADALALASIGVEAAVYDGSLVEWAADDSLPLVVG